MKTKSSNSSLRYERGNADCAGYNHFSNAIHPVMQTLVFEAGARVLGLKLITLFSKPPQVETICGHVSPNNAVFNVLTPTYLSNQFSSRENLYDFLICLG